MNKSTRGILGVEDPVVDSKDQDYKDAVAFDTFESIFSDASPVVRKLVSTSDSDAVLESEEIGDLQNLYRPGSLPELLERLRKLRDADPTDIAPTSIAGRKPINYRELVNRVLKKILKIFELKDSPQYKEASAVPMQVWEAAVSAMEVTSISNCFGPFLIATSGRYTNTERSQMWMKHVHLRTLFATRWDLVW